MAVRLGHLASWDHCPPLIGRSHLLLPWPLTRGSHRAWIPPDSILGPMILTVKLLLGRRCSLKVSGQESVAMLKKLVSERLQVPEEQQHLLFRGQLLADDKRLSDYCIGPNASINVIMRPLAKTAAAEAHQPQPLWHHLGLVLAKHFEPHDTKAVLQLLRREHQERLQKISLGDLEQLAQYLLLQEPLVEPAGERGPEAETSEPQHKKEETEEETGEEDEEDKEEGKADQ
ncbi:ubiquitin-like protein 4B [Vulpes vulpes]|uniref:Ubiquitin-like protein 4B n=1 Tax=Vulpes vulpes TaxID=9627 RepID=A0ABM4ZYK6_VULVU